MSTYIIRITGKNINAFLKDLLKKNIYFLNIEYINPKSCLITINQKSYNNLLMVKTSYEIELIAIKGVKYYVNFLKQNRILLLLLIIGIIGLIFLTNITFDIEVIHSNKEIRDLVNRALIEEGLIKYRLKINYSKQEEIVNNILNNYHDQIEWLEIENVGTKYYVRVVERKKNSIIPEVTSQNVIASKSGIIKKIIANQGEVVKKVNDYVKKGDIIITGSIKNQEILKKEIMALGIIYAETWYQVTIEMPFQYKEVITTGRKKKLLTLNIFNKKINLFDFNPYENSKSHFKLLLFNNIIPISLGYSVIKEQNVIDEIYTSEEAINKAHEIASNKINHTLLADEYIISQKDLKTITEDSKIIVTVFFKVYENITDYIKIESND